MEVVGQHSMTLDTVVHTVRKGWNCRREVVVVTVLEFARVMGIIRVDL